MRPSLTQEQQEIIASDGNMKVNAVAGSGKTTVILEYAKAKALRKPSLYLVFNRTAKEEAEQKAKKLGITNLSILTSHSLAYRHIRPRSQITPSYSPLQIMEILGIRGKYNFKLESMISKHIIKLTEFYCNSSAKKVRDVNYLSVLDDMESVNFVDDFFDEIYDGAKSFLTMMYRGQISIIHDYYLKMFQLSEPVLDFEHVFFDESQDASEVMLDVVKNQRSKKILVGDKHQRIYGWRYAVDSLNIDYPEFKLTGSFRFGKDIASEAVQVLDWKNMIDKKTGTVSITGLGGNGVSGTGLSHALLARTNAGVLKMAIELINDNYSRNHRLYFEGGLNSYIFGTESTSIYDVLNLSLGKFDRIRNTFIKRFDSTEDLKEYAKNTEDRDINLILEIVEEYGKELPGLISEIKSYAVNEKSEASFILSTVHRSKGLEYDNVKLGKDFITRESLNKTKISNLSDKEKSKLIEEINILYVAITRASLSLEQPKKKISDSSTSKLL